MSDAILQAITLLAAPGQVVEIRALGDRIASGYFDTFVELARVAEILDAPDVNGVYITLNPVSPALLSRRANRIKQRLTRSDPTTSDADIVSRRWLPIDIDPVRPSGISSSDREHQAALDRAGDIAAFLRDLGFPDPISADSGNGAHLLYRIDLPNDTVSRDLIAACLSSLDIRFSDELCRIDTANANAGRIWKLYGTISRKGDSTAERPHRRSGLISVPDDIRRVPPAGLTRLATLYPSGVETEPVPEKGKWSFDLRSWLDRYLPGYREKPYGGGTLYLLDTCPFSAAHNDGAYAIQFANGAIFAGCHHDSCGGGVQRWQELRERYEGSGSRNKKTGPESQSKSPVSRAALASPSSVEPAPFLSVQTLSPDESAPEQIAPLADRILREDHPLRYMLETFALDHEGDQVVAECLIMSLASRFVINSKGLHVSITGESGKGKSHTIDTILKQVPPAYRLLGRMSEKALFYIAGMQPGTVIALDDHSLSDQMQEILKGVTSSFHRPFVYHTVSKERTGQICTIPQRCVWWIAKVEGTGDDQVFNRMLTCWIDDSEDLDLRVLERALEDATAVPSTGVGERDENLICQEIWNRIDPVFVIIPYASRIQFHSASNRRNPDMLLDLIRSHAALMQAQREEQMTGGIRCIIATEEDFHEASRLYTSLNGECGGQMTKLTRREADLIESINSLSRSEVTVSDLQQVTGLSHSTINKLLNGYMSRGNIYSGLLEKCPAVSFLDRTITSGSEGRITQRRVRVYTWDMVLYQNWKAGGSVWLLPPPDDDTPDDNSPDRNLPDDPPMGGMAGEDGPKRSPADRCRPENPDNYPLNEKIINNTNYLKARAENPVGMKQVSEGPGEPSGDHHYRSAAHDGNGAALPGQNDEGSPIQREECSAHTSDPSARAASPSIDPGDFIMVEGWPQKKPCMICGRSYTHYQERMTPERIAGPPRQSRMLCTICYEVARVRNAMSVRTIPGVIDTSVMQHRSPPTGRCTVCSTGSAVWCDPAQQTSLCEACYHREQATARGET